VLAAWLVLAAAAAQGGSISEDEYWARLAGTLAWAAGDPPTAEWEQQARRWEAVDEVVLAGGAAVAVDTGGLVARLREQPPDPLRLKAYLAALQSARSRWPDFRDGSQELAALREVLARPEFQEKTQEAGPLERLWERAITALLRFMDRLLSAAGEANLAIPRWAIGLAAVLLLGAILGYVFRGSWRNVVREAALGEGGGMESERLSAQSALQRAQQFAGSREYRLAVRYLYLSALLGLDDRGLLRYNRTQTNRETLHQVSGQPELAARLRNVIDVFDRVWYGFHAVDESLYARYANDVAALGSAAEAGEEGA
jgi:hypothetical protein